MRRLFGCERGNSTMEFALVGPTFLMMIFLVLDGGRALFTKQALNELVASAARCAALHPSGCDTAANVQSWTASRGFTRSRLPVSASMVTATMSTSCNGQSGMAKVVIAMPYTKTAMNLLPQSAMPSTMPVKSCYPVTS